MQNGCSIRNTTSTPIVFVGGKKVLFVKPHEYIVYPSTDANEFGFSGLLPARYGVYNSLSLFGDSVTDAGVFMSVQDSTLVLTGTAVTKKGDVDKVTSIRNDTNGTVLLFGFVGDQQIDPIYLDPHGQFQLTSSSEPTFSLTVVTGEKKFVVPASDIKAFSSTSAIPIASYVTLTDASDLQVITYVIVKGRTYDTKSPYTLMLDIVTNDSISVQKLPELTSCKTLPSVQLSTSSRVTVICIMVTVLILLILFIVFFVLYLKNKKSV